jgi:hypothetical protein
LSTEQRKNPALGLIRHWLRPVNNYKIIIIQSQHRTQLKESEKQITILTKLQLKGKWDENEIMFRRNNKEFCRILLSLNLIMTLIINPLHKVSSKEYSV